MEMASYGTMALTTQCIKPLSLWAIDQWKCVLWSDRALLNTFGMSWSGVCDTDLIIQTSVLSNDPYMHGYLHFDIHLLTLILMTLMNPLTTVGSYDPSFDIFL